MEVALHSFNFTILLENEERKIDLVNQSFCDLFGIPLPPSQLVGLDCSIAAQTNKVFFVDEEDFVNQINISLENRKKVFDLELLMKDGRYLSRDYIPIFNEGNYIGHLWVYKDITNQKQSEIQVLNSLIKEKELGELKSKFVGMVSHEFRTPLAAISSSLELISLLNKNLNDKTVNHLNKINEQVRRMTELMNEVLLISKIEGGGIVPEFLEFDIKVLLEEVAREYEQNGFNINFDFKANDFTIQADRNMIYHVFSNLLSNATKYSEASNNVDVTISEYNRRDLIISVKDYGIGIPIKEHTKLFTSFYRASNIKNIPGTGLGLIVVKHFLDLHDAKISFNSEIGKGTEFIITIPRIRNQKV
jgi:signal transduction histidine kinase